MIPGERSMEELRPETTIAGLQESGLQQRKVGGTGREAGTVGEVRSWVYSNCDGKPCRKAPGRFASEKSQPGGTAEGSLSQTRRTPGPGRGLEGETVFMQLWL